MRPVFEPLLFRKIENIKPVDERVLFLDPYFIYANHGVDVFSRSQKHLSFPLLFPQSIPGVCACGCGQPLKGRRRRWASNQCTEFALNVWSIIDGQMDTIKYYINLYNKGTRRCDSCKGGRMKFELDHKIPVHAGGGGCWLNNYQRLCRKCHKMKTKADLNLHKERKSGLGSAAAAINFVVC